MDSSGTGDGGYTDTGTADGWTDSGADSGTDYGDGSTDGGYVDDSGGGSEYSGTE